jgi:hypothetical protein
LWAEVRDLFIGGVRDPDALLTDLQRQDVANAAEFHSGHEEAVVEQQLALILTLFNVVAQRSDMYERETVDVDFDQLSLPCWSQLLHGMVADIADRPPETGCDRQHMRRRRLCELAA